MRTPLIGFEPIQPGFPRTIHLDIPADFWADEALESGVLRAQIRSWDRKRLFATLSTEEGSIEREAPSTLVFALSRAATEAMARYAVVLMDFVRTSGGITSPVPGTYYWSVKATVTEP